MPKAIVIDEQGGPEVLRWVDVPMPEPEAGEVLIRQEAVGLNYIDVYHRTGMYPVPRLPITPGLEGAGVVEACGEGATLFKPGDRVMYCKGALGAYAQYRAMPEEVLLKIPDKIQSVHAAASLLRGETAHYLVRRTISINHNMTILVHAAAGGVGLILTQWAKILGATVIGTVGSEQKAALASEHGCDHVIRYDLENVVERVNDITKGEKCNVVYDSVGQATFEQSLDCLMPFGLLVSYGQSSGKIPPFDPGLLSRKGSLFLTRPTLFHYAQKREDYVQAAAEFLGWVLEGKIKLTIGQSFYLSDAANAHRALEGRKTTGASVMMVD